MPSWLVGVVVVARARFPTLLVICRAHMERERVRRESSFLYIAYRVRGPVIPETTVTCLRLVSGRAFYILAAPCTLVSREAGGRPSASWLPTPPFMSAYRATTTCRRPSGVVALSKRVRLYL